MATEWEDVLIAKGIIPQTTNDELDDELDDELLADDAFLSKYAQQRAKELRENGKDKSFGSLEEISQPEYERQVTLASETAWVIVLLYQNSISTCKVLSSILANMAETYQAIKFVKIQATRCIPDYPDKNVPTLLVYHLGNIVTQLVGSGACGGDFVSLDKLRRLLMNVGVPIPISDRHGDQSDSDGSSGDE